MRGGGLVLKDIENLQSVFDAAAGRDGHTKYVFFALIVLTHVEFETTAALGLKNGPARETAGDFSYVLLGITAVNPKRVQLHQFAAIVFIQPLFALLTGAGVGVRTRRLPVIEIEQHGRTLRGGEKQVFEFAEYVRPDDIALVTGDHQAVRAFIDIDVEVVVPEIGEHFIQLAIAVYGAQQLAGDKILIDHLERTAEDLDFAAKVGRGGSIETLAGAVRKRIEL